MSILLHKNEEMDTSCFVNNLVIPFAYSLSEGYENLIKKLISKGNWSIAKIDSKQNELFEHIKSFTADSIKEIENSNAILLQMTEDNQTFPKNKTILYDKKNPFSKFKFRSIQLYIIKSEIGFLIINLDYSNVNTLSEVISINDAVKSLKKSDTFFEILEYDYFNYSKCKSEIIKQISSKEQKESYCKITVFESDETQHCVEYIHKSKLNNPNDNIIVLSKEPSQVYCLNLFDFKQCICEWLSDFSIITFFNEYESGSKSMKLPLKAYVFTAPIIVNEGYSENEILSMFFRLRKAYKLTYKPSQMEMNIESNPEIYRPFEDSFWGVSKEGVANLTYSSNSFFINNYSNNLKTYFYIYLLALHQYYGLLFLAREVAKLPNSKNELNSEGSIAILLNLRAKINFFFLKNIFFDVSHITHQSCIYRKMIENFGIKILLEELQYEVDRITEIVRQEYEEEQKSNEIKRIEEIKSNEKKQKIAEKQEEQKRTKTYNSLTSIIAIISVICWFPSIVISIWDIIDKINGKKIPFYNTYFFSLSILIPLIILSIPVSIIAKFIFRWKRSENEKDSSKEIQTKPIEPIQNHNLEV